MFMNMLKKQFGFSLLELTVVVAIIGTLSTMAVVNYASIGKKSTVVMAAQNVASDIRKVQSLALNGKIYQLNKGYWGIYFNKTLNNNTSYIIFADKDQDKTKDSGEEYQTIDLPKNVIIKDFESGDNDLFAVYVPPDPKIIINNSGTVNSATVILSNFDGNNEKKVEINIFGLVDVE